jgi:3-deoxy-manno-octulosonate cytidylyltransferase (CMP-KDO synthetase)
MSSDQTALRAICVIPARMASSRFPDKPLKPMLGMPLLLHVWHRCRLYEGFERVVVATCDEAIHDAVTAAGGESVMTADTHERATDRTAEAVSRLKLGLMADDLVVMVQGDEALMSPDMAGQVVDAYRASRPAVVNLCSRIYRVEDHDNINNVKVVAAPNGDALYFSRAAIPSRARGSSFPMYLQTGVIGFAAEFLDEFARLTPTPLEKIESVDMLRVLEHGRRIKLVFTEREAFGVDTPDDMSRAAEILRHDPFTARYLGGAR